MPTEFQKLLREPIAFAPRTHLLTVDVEDWFHVNFASAGAVPADAPSRVESGVDATLALFDAAGVKATFFVLGSVAERHPQAVCRIADAGHEIACHSMHHDLVYQMERERFAEAATDARRRLEDASGAPVLGFRAPSWSICERNLWALDVIAEAGFRYDSSIFPGASPLYGIAEAPTGPYRLSLPSGHSLPEVPPSVLDFGVTRTGIGGGLYLRALPVALQRFAKSRYERRGEPFMVYVHPRELDPSAWDLRLPLSFLDQRLHRFGIRATPRKLRALLADGTWVGIAEALRTANTL